MVASLSSIVNVAKADAHQIDLPQEGGKVKL